MPPSPPSSHHSDTHSPIWQAYGCLVCGKVTLRIVIAGGNKHEQVQTHMTTRESRALFSSIREKIERHRVTSMDTLLAESEREEQS